MLQLSYFKPEYFRYYLPAFMIASIADPSIADVVPGSIVFHLDPSHRVVAEDAREIARLFSEPERKAVPRLHPPPERNEERGRAGRPL
jgi:hypothetical protein